MSHSTMVIDDNEVDRLLIKRHLKKAGVAGEIYEAENGVEALDFFKKLSETSDNSLATAIPTVIFLDINMPIMDGFEFLQKFAELQAARPDIFGSIVFAMFSSSEREEEKEKAMSYDFVSGYLVKGQMSPDTIRKIFTQTRS